MSDTVLNAPMDPWHLARQQRGLGRRAIGRAIRLTFATALLIGAAMVTVAAIGQLPASAPAPAAPPLPWREIVKPVHVYNLEAPVLAGTPLAYAARRHEPGGGREDVLGWGQLDGTRPALRLRLFRRGTEAPDARPLLAAVAHEAAQVGLSVVRSGVPYAVPTRFGAFEATDVTLAHPDGSARTSCAALRLVLAEPALSIGGLACGAFTRAQLGCLMERLDVASARDDRALIDFFAASELRRNAACAGMRLGPDTMHAAWLDDPEDGARSTSDGDKPATGRRSLRRR